MADDGMSRRELLVRAGIVVGAAIFSTIPKKLTGQTTAAAAPEGVLKTFTRLEYDTLDAICSRLIPTDETGPGAKEARAVRYIDWGLSGSITNGATLRPQYSAA